MGAIANHVRANTLENSPICIIFSGTVDAGRDACTPHASTPA
jgi:hypothetical protein